MNKAQKIEKYIRDYALRYCIPYIELFHEYDDESDELIELHIAEGTKLNSELVKSAAKVFGIEVENIMCCDEVAATKWSTKYPFFEHLHRYDMEYQKSNYKKSHSPTDRFLDAIFSEVIPTTIEPRYNSKEVYERLKDLLKNINNSLPGTYHENAHIDKMTIMTEHLCHYAEIDKLLSSYFSMVSRYEELFFTAIENELTDDDINEYNFLVTALGISDAVWKSSEYLYYDILQKFRHIYKNEGYKEIYSFVRFNRNRDFKPWHCAEFADYKDLAQKYLDIHQDAKKEMRDFAMKVHNFECYYVWSDAKHIQFSPDEEQEMLYIDEMLGEQPIPYEERAKEGLTAFVPKTQDELQGDDVLAERLTGFTRAESLGGLVVPKREINQMQLLDMHRMMERVIAFRGCSHE